MESWIRPLARVILVLLGLVLWAAAAALVFGGAFMILTYKNYNSFFRDCFLLVPGWLGIVSAFLLLLTGALALCIPMRNSRYQQGTFMYLLVVLLCLEASSAVLAQVYCDRLTSELGYIMAHFFHQYNGTYSHHPSNRAVDVIQRQLQCCGVHNYTEGVPESCCKEEGCLKKLDYRLQFVRDYIGVFTGVSGGLIWLGKSSSLVSFSTMANCIDFKYMPKVCRIRAYITGINLKT
uniref:Tetraspanin n=1 Tax=Pelusios castaneus TaxID=367368 RepID=A0A8C8RF03_9SAUR